MANQAIALQSRAPQTDFMGRAIQQNAQMMNMMAQQSAAQRQAEQAQQQMELARAGEARAVSAEERAERKAQQEYVVSRVQYFTDQLPSVRSDASWNKWLNQVGAEDREYADMLRRESGGRYDPDYVNRVQMNAEQYINKTIATPQASLQVGKDLETYSATVGGTRPGVTPLMVGGGSTQTPTSAFPTTAARATDAQIDEAAQKILRGAGVGELGISIEDFDRASARANELSAGGGARMQPISMAEGQQPAMGAGQPDLAAVVQDMMSSKQISQSDLQLMRDAAGPGKDAQLAQILRDNGIRIVPDDQASMRSAVFRPGEDAAPQMELAQAVNAPGTQFRVAKDPMQSPVPGSSQVPIPRVREEAAAARPSAPETYSTRRAADQAAADVKFLETVDGALDAGRNNLRLIDRAIGGARVDEKTGKVIYPSGGRKPHPGFEQVVGMGVPFLRLWPGSNEADFDTLLKQITGATFLQAFETLKGGGQITEKEGEKATEAISRLRRNISEKEFIIAANELRELMATAVKRAETRAARLRGQPSAPSGERRTPTKPKVLKYNPATGGFE